MAIGTLFTLLVVPAFYMMIAVDRAGSKDPSQVHAHPAVAH